MIPKRKNIRLAGYDYSQEGCYFVTIVTKNREPLFGQIINGEMQLSEYGIIIEYTWNDLANHNQDISLDEFIIMPNHIHGIIYIFDTMQSDCDLRTANAPTSIGVKRVPLSEIVRQLKTFSAKRINEIRNSPGTPVWQRNYYEHIIGVDREYEQIAVYIAENPMKWAQDNEYIP